MSSKHVLTHLSTVNCKMRGLVPERRKGGPRGQTKYEKKITKRMKKANKRLYQKWGKEPKAEPRSFLQDIFSGRR